MPRFCYELGRDTGRKRLAVTDYDLKGLCGIMAGIVHNRRIDVLKAGEDEPKSDEGYWSMTTVPHKGQVSDVKVQVGPQISIILHPHLTVMPVPIRIDDCFNIRDPSDVAKADYMLLGVEADDTVHTSSRHGDAVEASEACIMDELVCEEETADGLADLGLLCSRKRRIRLVYGPSCMPRNWRTRDRSEADSTALRKKRWIRQWIGVYVKDEDCRRIDDDFDDLQDNLWRKLLLLLFAANEMTGNEGREEPASLSLGTSKNVAERIHTVGMSDEQTEFGLLLIANIIIVVVDVR